MEIPLFKGLGVEDIKFFWFVADAVWKSQQITDDDLNKAQLVIGLQDRALSLYIKYCWTHPTMTMKETQEVLNNEFKKPKSQAHSIKDFNEIQ